MHYSSLRLIQLDLTAFVLWLIITKSGCTCMLLVVDINDLSKERQLFQYRPPPPPGPDSARGDQTIYDHYTNIYTSNKLVP